MITPFYKLCAADAAVVALLGAPPRIYTFGYADDESKVYPYVTFQVVSGLPENFLSGRPDADQISIQIDVWASKPASAQAVASAVRRAIELDGYITAWRGESRDTETGSYRVSFDADFIVKRE